MLFSTKLSNPLFALTKWITIGGVALLPIALVAIVLLLKVLRVTSQCPNQVDAIIVTSWPHTRRALACFKHSGPELSFYSVPAGFTAGIQHPHPEEWSLVVSEYLKIIRYLFLGRIDLNDL